MPQVAHVQRAVLVVHVVVELKHNLAVFPEVKRIDRVRAARLPVRVDAPADELVERVVGAFPLKRFLTPYLPSHPAACREPLPASRILNPKS